MFKRAIIEIIIVADLQKHIDIQKYIKYSEITDSSVIQGGIIWVERN